MKPSRAKTPSRLAATRTPLAPVRTPLSLRSTRTPIQPRRQISREDAEKDPVEVYCRLRPGEDGESCVKVLSDVRVQLVPPTTSKAFSTGKELQCSFKCKSILTRFYTI